VNGLTVRLDDGHVVASDDHGRSARLPSELGSCIRDAFESAEGAAYGVDLTAGTLAALAEAQAAQPRVGAGTPPAWRDTGEGAAVRLAHLAGKESRPLSEVLRTRRSRRQWHPPALNEIAAVLVRSARVLDFAVGDDGYVMTHRPTPSAGARHPLDLHVLASHVDGLAPGAWRFDPVRCELVETRLAWQPTLRQLGDVMGSPVPPAAVVLVAHLDRTLARYPTGMSLVWRDAGALLATLHLAATDVDLASCMAGTCGLMLNGKDGVVDVGALVVGRPAV
jgi:SagB-type dehydrogenase family enzyme